MAEAATEKTSEKKPRTRKPTQFALGWVTETAPETDADGKEIPGSERTCIVLLNLPPGLDDAQKRSRDAIQRACKRAVYEDGLEEFGNKKLRVISFGEDFQYDFKKIQMTTTKLVSPDEVEKLSDSGEPGVTVDVKEVPDAASSGIDESDDSSE